MLGRWRRGMLHGNNGTVQPSDERQDKRLPKGTLSLYFIAESAI